MALIAENISFAYDKRLILDGINIKVEPGNFYGFLGKNGSGKTTLLKILNGILVPKKGKVWIQDEDKNLDILSSSRKIISKEIGFVPQEHRGVFPYPVIEMVVMGRNPHLDFFSKPKDEDYEIAIDALKAIGIEYLTYKNFTELSGGEKQMVLVARVIAQGAKYLILDEPTSHLDFKNQYQILRLIKRVCKERNVAAILSMHDPNLTVNFADYILMLKDGQIMQEGYTKEVMTDELLSSLYEINVEVNYAKDGRYYILAET